jgi:hypothetical protein
MMSRASRCVTRPSARRRRTASSVPRALARDSCPPPHEHEGLHEELGLADAAGAELEVALGRVAEGAACALDERHHLDGDLRIDAAPVHEGRQGREHLLAERALPRHGPRAQEGRALPEAAE